MGAGETGKAEENCEVGNEKNLEAFFLLSLSALAGSEGWLAGWLGGVAGWLARRGGWLGGGCRTFRSWGVTQGGGGAPAVQLRSSYGPVAPARLARAGQLQRIQSISASFE